MSKTIEGRIESIAAKLPEDMPEKERYEAAKSLDILANILIDMKDDEVKLSAGSSSKEFLETTETHFNNKRRSNVPEMGTVL